MGSEELVGAADDAGLWTVQTAIFPENRDTSACTTPPANRTLGLRERIGRHHNPPRNTVFLDTAPHSPSDSPDDDRSAPPRN